MSMKVKQTQNAEAHFLPFFISLDQSAPINICQKAVLREYLGDDGGGDCHAQHIFGDTVVKPDRA